MFVLAVSGGLARTLVAEVDAGVDTAELDAVVSRLNERLAGLTLDELRRTGARRLHDLGGSDHTGIVRVVLRESPRLFGDAAGRRALLGGVPHLVEQPEFQLPGEVRSVVELVEDQEVIVHLLERPTHFEPGDQKRAVVRIGEELRRGAPASEGAGFAAVSARYVVGGAIGTVGVIGPTRMDYARAVALVEHIAALLSAPND
jgi:heat-inducible transcriptional repressor